MKTSLFVVLAASGMLAPCLADSPAVTTAPPATTPGTTAQSPGDAAKAPEKEVVICKKVPPPLGTRIGGQTICKTEAQWEKVRQDSMTDLQRMQRGGGALPSN